MRKKTLFINRKKFFDWYFDSQTIESMFDDIAETLYDKGKVVVKLQDFLDGVGYLSIDLIVNKKDIDKKDIDDNEIEEPGKIYNLAFKGQR